MTSDEFAKIKPNDFVVIGTFNHAKGIYLIVDIVRNYYTHDSAIFKVIQIVGGKRINEPRDVYFCAKNICYIISA